MLRPLKNINEEETVSKDRYLITYADLITLLLGLFVILYASAQVDEEKYKEFSQAMSEYFKVSATDGSDGVLELKKPVPEPIIAEHVKAGAAVKSLDDVEIEAQEALAEFIREGLLEIKRSKEGLTVTMDEKLLFNSGKSGVVGQGVNSIKGLADVLKGVKFQIAVDGHTDSDPIRTFQYESNWHLSIARAMNVGYKLIQYGVPENHLIIRGFGAQRPIESNATEEGKTKNRRVEINITPLSALAPSTNGYADNNSKNNM